MKEIKVNSQNHLSARSKSKTGSRKSTRRKQKTKQSTSKLTTDLINSSLDALEEVYAIDKKREEFIPAAYKDDTSQNIVKMPNSNRMKLSRIEAQNGK
jgi:hypothetical protein